MFPLESKVLSLMFVRGVLVDYMQSKNRFKLKANLKKTVRFLSPTSQKNKSPGWPVNFFLNYSNIPFYFKCYLHHNCSVNLN